MAKTKRSDTIPKRNRWKKGSSSMSNPTSSSFRDAAKGRFFQPLTQTAYGKRSLTVNALQRHNEHMEVAEMEAPSESGLTSIYSYKKRSKPVFRKSRQDFAPPSESDITTVNSFKKCPKSTSKKSKANSAATFKSWATSFTECSNTTFNSVYKAWNNDSVKKETLAVLAAVTEIIRTQGGQESETEYFAVLMTTLEGAEEVETVSATAHLLSIIMRKVPRNLLITKYDQISTVMIQVLTKHMDNTALVMKAIRCLTSVLRALDVKTWNKEVTKNIYDQILALFESDRPKIRKTVKQSVDIILRTSLCLDEGVDVHPVAVRTQQYCTDRLNGLINNTLVQKLSSIASCADITRTLQLFGGVMFCFPKGSLKTAAEFVLKLMSLNNVVVKGTSLELLNKLFMSKPHVSRLTADMNAKMITALYDFIPNANDVQLVAAWLLVMENAHINLVRNDAKFCLSLLPKFFNTCIELLHSVKKQCVVAAAVSLKAMLNGVITQVPFEEVEQQGRDPDSPIYKLFDSLGNLLTYQFSSSWGYSLQVISLALKVIGKPCPELMSKLLPIIAKMRENPDLPYKAEADAAIGSAITYIGPRIVLEVLPLDISPENSSDIERSWLMPLLTHRVNDTELGFFVDFFLPLAAECQSIANGARTNDGSNAVPRIVYGTLVQQIWSLLPRFCTRPTDLLTSFKRIAKTLGLAITERPDLRKHVLTAIRKLISNTADKALLREEIAKYAKNYLPILFNIFTTDADDFRVNTYGQMSVLATIREYTAIAAPEHVLEMYDKCISKLKSGEIMSIERRNALLDLAINMAHYLDDQRLEGLLKYVPPLLSSTERVLQKKGYRFLETICQMKSPNTAEFVMNNTERFEKLLVENLSQCTPGTKGPRIRCLNNIFKTLESNDSNKQFLVTVLPEAMLSVREPGHKTRSSAFELLETFCECMIRWNGGDETAGVMEVINLMFAGLAGSSLMVVSTLHSVTTILFTYRAFFSEENLSLMLDQACTLLQSKSREILSATFAMLKCVVGSFTAEALTPNLKKVCDALAFIKKENKVHFRFKVKEVLIKLVKKFGHEPVVSLMPDVYQKPLINIKKRIILEKRMKALRRAGHQEEADAEGDTELDKLKKAMPETIDDMLVHSDSELEDDEEKGRRETKERREKLVPTWLRDDSNEITDLLDKKASQNVMVSRPTVREPIKNPEDLFKMGADGRMIITDLEADEKAFAASGKAEVDDIDEIFDQFENEDSLSKQKKKKFNRKSLPFEDMSMVSSVASSKASRKQSFSQYRPGGKGIHRPRNTTGDEYKSKRGSGDAKKNNKHEPYAYVPFDVKSLNKRKRAKLQGQYKGLVGGVKRGASQARKSGKVIKRRI